jgi:hypothetical protein
LKRIAKLDALTRQNTGFSSFTELTTTDTDYFPTLVGEGEVKLLADAYDAEMARRGDPRRSWRGSNTKWLQYQRTEFRGADPESTRKTVSDMRR